MNLCFKHESNNLISMCDGQWTAFLSSGLFTPFLFLSIRQVRSPYQSVMLWECASGTFNVKFYRVSKNGLRCPLSSNYYSSSTSSHVQRLVLRCWQNSSCWLKCNKRYNFAGRNLSITLMISKDTLVCHFLHGWPKYKHFHLHQHMPRYWSLCVKMPTHWSCQQIPWLES